MLLLEEAFFVLCSLSCAVHCFRYALTQPICQAVAVHCTPRLLQIRQALARQSYVQVIREPIVSTVVSCREGMSRTDRNLRMEFPTRSQSVASGCALVAKTKLKIGGKSRAMRSSRSGPAVTFAALLSLAVSTCGQFVRYNYRDIASLTPQYLPCSTGLIPCGATIV